MTDTSIFQGDKPVEQQTEQQKQEALLVGEGRKYKSVDELEKAYLNADEFIEKLKEENRQLREATTKAKTIDDVLERLQQGQQDHVESAPAKAGVSAADLTELVKQTVTGLETQKTREANLLKADKLMKDSFGEKAAEMFNSAAKTPELKAAYMQLAATDPERFVTLFGSAPKQQQSLDTGTQNTQVQFQVQGRQSQPGTKEYFDHIRKTDKNLYYSQRFQLEMDKTVRNNPDLYYGKR